MSQEDTSSTPEEESVDPGFGPAEDAVEGAESIDGSASLSEQLAAATARAESEHQAFLRARADFANFKRRTEEERESLRTYLSSDLLTRLLPIVDNFERALTAAESTRDYEKLVTGINAVYRQLQEYLTRAGVTAIDAVDQPFDPNLHNAVLREETTEHPENTVIEELQKGYQLNGKVLRATMVKVASGAD